MLVAVHRRARVREARARALAKLNRRGSARVRRDWASLPPPHEEVPDHPYAIDLDVAGTPASLYRLIDVVSGATGQPKLLHWLLDPPPSIDELRERRPAITELATAIDLREELALLARPAANASPRDFETFLTWAESPPWLGTGSTLIWLARIIPIVTVVTAVLAFFRMLPWTAPGLSIICGLLVLARFQATLETNFKTAISRATGLRAQRQMLERLAHVQFDAPLLQRQQQCAADGLAALSALDRALSLLEGRGSLVHAIVAPILLWDLHALAWLDRWRARHGRRLRACLDALGTIEALAALGTLAHDNPAWSFPELDAAADRLTAVSLAHPLLPPTTRVANDVTVGPPGTLLLVTGSNMSGKSTLLRAVGLNAVLAQAGAPVCAESLTMPLVEVRTSIRLADSLERGVSLFMAELERLKGIVDAARAPDRTRRLLYLLDEILHGTNTAERLIAARTVLGYLVQAGAIGAVTTHDLTLAADGSLAAASRPVHFTEQVSGNGDAAAAMTFDYRLRPGLATSTNALKLLALVGLASAPGEAARPLKPLTRSDTTDERAG